MHFSIRVRHVNPYRSVNPVIPRIEQSDVLRKRRGLRVGGRERNHVELIELPSLDINFSEVATPSIKVEGDNRPDAALDLTTLDTINECSNPTNRSLSGWKVDNSSFTEPFRYPDRVSH